MEEIRIDLPESSTDETFRKRLADAEKRADELVRKLALELAAQVWCDPLVSHMVLDENLTEAIANKIYMVLKLANQYSQEVFRNE